MVHVPRSTTKRRFAPERQGLILRLITERKSVSVTELASYFGVTATTIRSDLDHLGSRGLIRRAHGGAIMPELLDLGPPLAERVEMCRDEKERIGRVAATLIREGESIILDIGTTTAAVAKQLGRKGPLTIITCSLDVLAELDRASGVTVISTGGVLLPEAQAFAGHIAERMLRDIHASKVFLSAGGVSFDTGITVPRIQLVGTKQAMIRAVQEVILVVDHTKFGRRSLHAVCSLSAVHRVVTDEAAPTEYVEGLRALGIDVILA